MLGNKRLPHPPIHGTVYGVLLNAQREWALCEHVMHESPYQSPPSAPVLYIKTANTWSAHDAAIALPANVPSIEVGATLGVVIGEPNANDSLHVSGFVLLNDVSIPHGVAAQGFYRPPIKYKNLDGFLGIGPHVATTSQVPYPNQLTLEVHINGVLQQTVDLQTMRRLLPQLLTDVGAFTPLQAGDVLMLGLDVCGHGPEAGHRPHARAGDVIDIRAPQCAALGHLRNSLVQEAA